jgi:transposase InsO family protein
VDLARYVVDAVVLERRSAREVARAHGVSKSWVAELVCRFRAGGYEAIQPRSRRPNSVPLKTCGELENEIVLLRKQLTEDGFDAGAHTIHHHLSLRHSQVPSVATIWRVLKRRGFVTPQPQKRPRSSYVRFEASLPNELWQSDVTFWQLADETKVEIIDFIDDYSRVALGSRVVSVTNAPDVVAAFHSCAETWGLPAGVLTDNGCVYTAAHRNGRSAMESELLALGIAYKHSRPYHPQTCGKVERFHQTLKKYLAKQPAAESIEQLQSQVDRFIDYYNYVRPHRAKGRITPKAAFDGRDKAKPSGPKIEGLSREVRVRHDKVDKDARVTLRYRSRLLHIGMGRANRGKRVTMLVAGLDVRVVAEDGQMLRHLTLDPTRDFQGNDLECPR